MQNSADNAFKKNRFVRIVILENGAQPKNFVERFLVIKNFKVGIVQQSQILGLAFRFKQLSFQITLKLAQFHRARFGARKRIGIIESINGESLAVRKQRFQSCCSTAGKRIKYSLAGLGILLDKKVCSNRRADYLVKMRSEL